MRSIFIKPRIFTRSESFGSSISVPVSVANGGTGITSYAVGDLIYASGITTLSKLAIGTANQQLRVNAGATALEYFTPASSGITIGSTTIASGADNRILYQDATASDYVTQTANFTMGAVASGFLDVPTGYAMQGSKVLQYNVSGVGGLSLGIGADAAGGGFYYHNLAIGINATATAGGSCIAIGYGATTTGASQLVIGSSGDPITNVYIGNGVTAVSPSGTTYNATGGSGSNIAGANLTEAAGKATGNAAGGNKKTQTSVKGSSGSTLQSLTDRHAEIGKYVDLTESSATTFGTLALTTSGTIAGGVIVYTVEANDGTDYQSLTGTAPYSVVNKAGTLTYVLGTDTQSSACSTGTLTGTLSLSASGTSLQFQMNAVSSLSQAVLRISFQVLNNFGVATIAAA